MARESFNDLWASNPDPDQYEEVPPAIFEKGWEGGADKPLPQAKWENWWHRRVDLALQQIERDGVLEHLMDVPYDIGAPVKASDGANYLSLVDGNLGNDPTEDDGTNWRRYARNGAATTELFGMIRYATIDQHLLGNAQNLAASPRGVREMIERFAIPLISINGPGSVTQVSTNKYEITNYNSFSIYTVSASTGTATISGSTITLEIVAGDNAESDIDLTVTRDEKEVTFNIGVINANINQPVNVYPADGATDVPIEITLEASDFSVTGDTDTPTGSQWRIYDSFSGQLVYDSGEISYSTTHTVPSGELSPTAATYEWQVAYRGATYGLSQYSQRTLFTTVDEFIATPSVTSPENGATDQPEQPVLESSAFSVTPSGADTHETSSWRIKDADGTVVWESINNPSALLAIMVPAGVLSESTTYNAEVRHEGTFLVTPWSTPISFTTENSFIPTEPGAPFGGGFFTAVMYTEPGGQGERYALVTAPKAEGEASDRLNWNEARAYCAGLTIGGHSDWQLPTIDERRMEYRVYKPTTLNNRTDHGATDLVDPPLGDYTSADPSQTLLDEFQEGGSESFINRYYWTDTEFDSNAALSLSFTSGDEISVGKGGDYKFRAVRRVYF